MPYKMNQVQLGKLAETISQPRLETYLSARSDDRRSALALYRWNTEISGAFMVPLQFCEVAVRNAITGAIARVYGPDWHQSSGFLQSLPAPSKGYSPRHDLESASYRRRTAGHVVADLRFAFWGSMLTSRHDARLWRVHLRNQFPGLPSDLVDQQGRALIHDQLEKVREFRNRVAHHEPIFKRNLRDEYDRIWRLIAFRDDNTANWLHSFQIVTKLLDECPLIP
jgi:hypothetical protein